MVSQHRFAHYSSGHRDHMDRIAASNYKPNAGCWTAGENLYSSNAALDPQTAAEGLDGEPGAPPQHPPQGLARLRTRSSHHIPHAATPSGLTIVALFGIRGGSWSS